MKKLKPDDAFASSELLLEQEQYAKAVEVLGRVSSTLASPEEWQKPLNLLQRIPHHHRLESVEAAFLYAKALKWSQKLEALFAWATQVIERHGMAQGALVQLEWASGLLIQGKYAQARDLLDEAIPYLSGEALGIAWSRLGYAQFHLGEPWQEAYSYAHSLLTGEELGRALLNEGHFFAEVGQILESRKVWFEALSNFKRKPYFLALTRYNLGISALRDLDIEAERHFLEAVYWTRHPKAANLRAPVLNGLGATRRALGEWNRAEAAYREALKAVSDSHDRKESYLGWVRTLRLSGRITEALETLELALQESSLEHTMLYVAQAMAFLALGQPKQAKAALEKAGTIRSESDRWIWRIASAELARFEDRLDEAVQLLEGLPLHTLHSREEVRQWPKLFALLEAAGREIPRLLEYVQGTTVRVQALGVLQVSVNDRLVELIPTGRVGELLVFLLEQGGAASLEAIGDALYPDLTQAPKRRKAVWKLVNGLREALGWEGSVLALRGAYQLDPKATWLYDVAEARAKGEFRGEFLAGVYSEWALEVGRELQDLAPPQRLELN